MGPPMHPILHEDSESDLGEGSPALTQGPGAWGPHEDSESDLGEGSPALMQGPYRPSEILVFPFLGNSRSPWPSIVRVQPTE